MTSKVLTLRVPAPVYSRLCEQAGELGVPVSAHVRRVIERESEALGIEQLRREILEKLAEREPSGPSAASSAVLDEVLLLAQGIAAHLHPQLVAQVKAKLGQRGRA
jgi:hypothetical protein